jgi:hypothetical protein
MLEILYRIVQPAMSLISFSSSSSGSFAGVKAPRGDMFEYFVLEILTAVWVYNGKGFGNRMMAMGGAAEENRKGKVNLKVAD